MIRRPAPDTWHAALGDLQLQVTKPVYDTWLSGTRAVSLDDHVLCVEVPTPFAVEWLERRMYQIVLKTLHRVTGESIDVRFQVAAPRSDNWAPEHSTGGRDLTHSGSCCPLLNRHFTFSNFIVGPSNQLAFSAAQAVATALGYAYNPLFIYSTVGLGKTHLLQAIGNGCAQQGARVSYVTSEQFTNDFIQGIRNRTTAEFRAQYRSVDLLLIDDIQFIGGKEQTQESFFHTFNELYSSNKQIVLTSDRPPKALTLLEDRLRSRFESGLIADIQAPPLETRIAILRSKAERMNIQVEDRALEYIARRMTHSVRELEGALNRVAALAQVQGQPITPELASTAIQGMTPPSNGHRAVSPEQVIEAAGKRFSATPQDILGPRRTKYLVRARHTAMYLMREDLGLRVTEIGRIVGDRDHTTVIHAIRHIEDGLGRDPEVAQDIASIRESLGA